MKKQDANSDLYAGHVELACDIVDFTLHYLRRHQYLRSFSDAEFLDVKNRVEKEASAQVRWRLWTKRGKSDGNDEAGFPPLTKKLFEDNQRKVTTGDRQGSDGDQVATESPSQIAPPGQAGRDPDPNSNQGNTQSAARDPESASSAPAGAVDDRLAGHRAPQSVLASESAKRPAETASSQPPPPARPTLLKESVSAESARQPTASPPRPAPTLQRTAMHITRKESFSCKPGKLNTAYAEALPVWVAAMRERHVDGLPAGIRLRDDGVALEGSPTAAGESKAVIRGRTADGRPVELTLHIPVLPDPKSLWKSIPSDQSGRFAKPDVHGDYQRNVQPGLTLLAGSVRGRSHAQKGTYRDDDYCVRRFPSGWIVVATADGAGSAEFSRRGSQLAVHSAAGEFEERLSTSDASIMDHLGDVAALNDIVSQCAFRAASKAVDAIDDESAREGIPLAKFSTTLILIAMRPIGERWLVAAFSIGDGGAAIWFDDKRSVRVLTKGDSGEFAGQTKFLRREEVATAELVKARSVALLVERPTAVFAMTDGITDPKFETDALFQSDEHWCKFWREDLRPALELGDHGDLRQRLLAWMEFWSPGNHDDRTLAAVMFEAGD